MSNPPTIDIAGPPHAPEVLATERTSCASELRRPPLGGDQPRPLGSTICGRTWMHVIFLGYTGTDIGRYTQPGSNGLAFDPQGRLTTASPQDPCCPTSSCPTRAAPSTACPSCSCRGMEATGA